MLGYLYGKRFGSKIAWADRLRLFSGQTFRAKPFAIYRIFSNLIRTSFADFLNEKKKLVRGSNPHLWQDDGEDKMIVTGWRIKIQLWVMTASLVNNKL